MSKFIQIVSGKKALTSRMKTASCKLTGKPPRIDYTGKYGRIVWPPTEVYPALKRVHRLLIKDVPVTKELLLELESGYALADDLVDELVVKRKPIAQPLIDHVKHNTPLPDYLADTQLANELLTQPDWFDAELAKTGAKAYQRYPLLMIWLLRNVSLMAGYSIPALSIPLLKTGELVKHALPRLLRTYEFILAVSQPSGLEIGSEGWQQCVKVREIHAFVRQGLWKGSLDGEGWDENQWGKPINQTDMIATHMQFSLLMMRGFKMLGARLTNDESRGMLHLWQLASYWLGVDIARIPSTESASWQWLYSYVSSQQLDFSVGQPLAKALHDLPTQLVGADNRRAQFIELLNASVTRVLAGDDFADGLQLPDPKYKQALLMVPPTVFAFDLLTERVPLVRKRIERVAQKRHAHIAKWMRQFAPVNE